ncbi:MAG: (2Fe-2S)-binding protein [Actinomycetota bacterium]
MYVCLCRGVTDRKIRAAIAGGATDLVAVGERTQAGIECGTCHPGINELLREARDPDRPAQMAAGRPKGPKGSDEGRR